jgi:two-component system, NarL family, invasion response regulator UvrY
MKILIADDHSVVREGLKNILKGQYMASHIDEAKDGQEALDKILKGSYDFIIMDISMPILSGIDVLQTLKNKDQKEKILILSMHPQEQYAIRVLRLGASGYLSKESAYEELITAINKITAGGKYISSVIAEKLVFNFNDQPDSSLHESLSEREFQIMLLLAKGIGLTEIGKQLFISDKTVSTYRSRLMEKLGMKKNAELTLYALKNNLIE